MASKPLPKGLKAGGRKLWTDVVGKWDLRPDELRVLREAAGEVDLIDTLEQAAESAELIVRGSQGQPVINPLISELRQHRATLAGLLRSLKLPDETDTSEARSTQARAAANARWSKRGA
ncbi:hypothetical protein [Nocardia australiensis]|uniref:hypothetical protein n=1 Tax=Nocardia australiensis TaxID=2887191 RepID=UPI001D136AF9|nr:hypothetical protein [Nocardia australiensis]